MEIDTNIFNSPINIEKGLQIPEIRAIVERKEAVLKHFGPIFREPSQMEEKDYLEFLNFKGNGHWSGLERRGKEALTNGLEYLRSKLLILVDENRLLSERFDICLEALQGVGHGTLSAILLVAFPDRYGVWNNVSEAEMRKHGLWPTFKPRSTQGEKYVEINNTILSLCRKMKVDAWTLDTLWWSDRLAQKESGCIYDEWKIAIAQMVENTVHADRYANGQKVEVRIKNKEMKFNSKYELEKYLQILLKESNYNCAITGLGLQTRGGDPQLYPSLDRIDSDGHYEEGNLQVVARFINQWKSSSPDSEFRRLISLVRGE